MARVPPDTGRQLLSPTLIRSCLGVNSKWLPASACTIALTSLTEIIYACFYCILRGIGQDKRDAINIYNSRILFSTLLHHETYEPHIRDVSGHIYISDLIYFGHLASYRW